MAEESREAWAHSKQFANLLAPMGWRLVADVDTNFRCAKCQPYKHSEKPRVHGIDAMFVMVCPFSRMNRLVVIDGKRYALTSYSPKLLKEHVEHLTEACLHLADSIDLVEEDHDVPESPILDTCILVWDCHTGLDHGTATKWYRELGPSRPRRPLQRFIWDNRTLDRLATLSQYLRTIHSFVFLYDEWRAGRSKVLAPELLASAVVPLAVRQSASASERLTLLVFDELQEAAFGLHLTEFLRRNSSAERVDLLVVGGEANIRRAQSLAQRYREEMEVQTEVGIDSIPQVVWKVD
jgi:hypothetical protein